jgi:hypothetical protein
MYKHIREAEHSSDGTHDFPTPESPININTIYGALSAFRYSIQ